MFQRNILITITSEKSGSLQQSSIFTFTINKEVLEKAAEIKKAKLRKKEENERVIFRKIKVKT